MGPLAVVDFWFLHNPSKKQQDKKTTAELWHLTFKLLNVMAKFDVYLGIEVDVISFQKIHWLGKDVHRNLFQHSQGHQC